MTSLKSTSGFSANFEFLGEERLFVAVNGTPTEADVSTFMQMLADILSKKKGLFLFVEISSFKWIPWKQQMYAYSLLKEWFTKGLIKRIFVINPNSTVRLLAYLGGKLFPEIKQEFHPDLSAATERLNQLLHSEQERISREFEALVEGHYEGGAIKVLNSIHMVDRSNGAQMQCFIIKPDIVFCRYKKKVTPFLMNAEYDFLEENLPKKERFWNYVSDIPSKLNLNREVRGIFRNRTPITEAFYKAKYFNLDKRFHYLLKLYRFLDPDFFNKSMPVKNAMQTAMDLLSQRIPIPLNEQIIEKPDLKLDISIDLSHLGKEELIEIIKSQSAYIRSNQQKINERVSEIENTVARITWEGTFEKKTLATLDEADPFSHLYSAMNLLQDDIESVIEELENVNDELTVDIQVKNKELKERFFYLHNLIDNYSSPIWLMNRELEVIDYSSACIEVIKKERKLNFNYGEPLFANAPEVEVNQWLPHFQSAIKGNEVEFERSANINGKDTYFTVKILPIQKEKEILGVAVITNDVTALRNSVDTLEKKNEDLERLNAELDSFIYRSSHDMRAPIASMLGLIEMAQKEKDEKAKKDQLQHMRNAILKMDDFIHEITDIIRNTRQELIIEPIEVLSLTHQCLEELAYVNELSELVIEIDIKQSLPFHSDSSRLKAIMKNLIANSIKYRATDRPAHIKVMGMMTDDGLNVSVWDNGIGIKPELLPNVFEMFYRGTKKSTGSGLGLFIVKDMSQKLGGDVSIGSKENEWTKAEVRLPNLHTKPVEREMRA